MLYWLAEAVTRETMIGSEILQLLVAIALILLAAGLLFLELVVVSGGLLGLTAAGLAGLGCYLAWEIGPTAFYATLVATPLAAVLTIRFGLQRLQHSNMVTQAVIDGNAGYEHVASRIGVSVGSSGTLVTNAMPTGRAKFANGEIDVIVHAGAGSRGDTVKVIEIDGPSVYVMIPKN